MRAPALPADERRSAIVRVTIPLLLEHGDQVTTRLIAEAAGIAEGTIFRVFPDKEALLDAAIDAALDPDPLEAALGRIDPARPLEEVVTKAVQILQHRGEHVWRLLARLGARAHDRKPRLQADSPALAALLEAHRDEIAVAPAVAARQLRALTFALSHPLMVERPSPPKEIARLFLHGVTPC